MTRDKKRRLVAVLLRMTNDGSLRWEKVGEPEPLKDPEMAVSARLSAEAGPLRFSIFQVSCSARKEAELYGDRWNSQTRPFWETRTVLEVVHRSQNDLIDAVSDVEYLPTLVDLYGFARSQAMPSDRLVDAFLNNPDSFLEEKELDHAPA